jgi:hypothetical protein
MGIDRRFAAVLVMGLAASAAVAFGPGFRGRPDASRGAKIKEKKFKVTDNESPTPQDRVFFAYNYYAQNNGETGGFAVQPMPPSLQGDFRVQVTTGPFGEDTPPIYPGFSCLEVDVVGSEPLQFFAACAQVSPSGTYVFFAQNGNSNVGNEFFSGTQIVDLDIQVNGDTLSVFARPNGTESWTEVGSTTAPSPDVLLQPFLGAASMAHGGKVDFTAFQVVEDGGGAPSNPNESARLALQRARAAANDARRAMGPPSPDRAKAAEFLNTCKANLEAYQALVPQLPQNATVTKGSGKVDKALDKVNKALEQTGGDGTAVQVQNGCTGIMKDLDRAWKYLEFPLTGE